MAPIRINSPKFVFFQMSSHDAPIFRIILRHLNEYLREDGPT